MNRRAIYPGTFDPITYGHLDIIERASRLYDRVFVAVAHGTQKSPLFSIEERVTMLRKVTSRFKNVAIEDFSGLVVNYAKIKGISVIIRGLRMHSDFEYEFQMALTNRKLASKVETVFMMTGDSFAYLSSKLIKEAVSLGADVKSFVPSYVAGKLRKKFTAH
ncbi:MAG: pantetheine-phosphate adenylyltransferase [Candidatus Omnitrophota bacterium]